MVLPVISANSLIKHKPDDLAKLTDDQINEVLKNSARHSEDSHEDLKRKQ